MTRISDIGDRLLRTVTNILREHDNIASPDMLACANAEIKAAYDDLEAAGQMQVPFEGCRIIGGAACVVLDEMRIMPITAFHPQARYLHDDRDAIALGFYGAYDLYFQASIAIPPTLIARFGDQPPEYKSFNPTFSKLTMLGAESRSVFGEAVRRAQTFSLVR